jgi:hypothetical protein
MPLYYLHCFLEPANAEYRLSSAGKTPRDPTKQVRTTPAEHHFNGHAQFNFVSKKRQEVSTKTPRESYELAAEIKYIVTM